MQIHELNNFAGTLGSGAYLAIDNGTDTGRISSQNLLASTEARIDAANDQITDVKSALGDTQSAIENVAGIITLVFELGGLYSSTGKEYASPNIRTSYIQANSGEAIGISNPNLKTIRIFEYTNTTDNCTTSTAVVGVESSVVNLRSDTKYIRLQVGSSPQNLSDGDRITIHYYVNQLTEDAKVFSDLSNGGVLKSWDVTSTIKAILYNNGKFMVVGTGTAGESYTPTNLPPWNENKYMRCIKEIQLDTRIKYYNLQYWFTQYSNGNPVFYNNEYYGSINLPKDTTSLGFASFGQFDYHHINLCNVVSNGAFNIAPNRHKRFILSVPSSLCDSTNIIEYITETAMPGVFQNNSVVNNATAMLLIITDDADLQEAVLDKIDELTEERGSLCNAWTNCSCIKCDALGEDGFPATWTEPMKRCLLEIAPYIGRQSLSRETNAPDSPVRTFGYDGLTSIGNYSGYGYPQVFSPKSNADIFTHMSNARRRFAEEKELGELNTYLGQPYSTDISNLTSGVSCSGLVTFIFWRYFNENFSLATCNGFYRNIGQFGNNLPLVEVQKSELKPFDICCMAYDLDEDGEITDNDAGGHTAIVLGTREVNGEIIVYILQALMGIGIVFGTWKYETEQGMAVNFKRLNKGGISENMLV